MSTTILNTLEIFCDITGAHLLPSNLDKFLVFFKVYSLKQMQEILYSICGLEGKLLEWGSNKNQMMATDKLCTIIKRLHSNMQNSIKLIPKLLIFEISAVFF